MLISLCERAEKLGLQFVKDNKKQYKFTIDDILGIKAECIKFELTTQNGYGQGYTMIEVWTRKEAEVLRGHIDLYIMDSNPKRYTEITKSPHTSTSIEDLKWFIKTHSKGKI